MLGNIGSVELFVIMLTILLVFGAKRIPEIARGVGGGIREFRSAMREISSELKMEDQQMHDATNIRPAPSRRQPSIEVVSGAAEDDRAGNEAHV